MTPDPLREQLARLGELAVEASNPGCNCSECFAWMKVASFVACLTDLLDLPPSQHVPRLGPMLCTYRTTDIRDVIARHFPAPEGGGE